MKHTFSHLMLATTFGFISVTIGHANTISAAATAGSADLTAEMLMEVQLQDELLLQTALPWSTTDAVTYTSSYDTATKAFSFATVSGQSVGGSPFTFSTTAQYDGSLDTWSWSGTGQAGDTFFQITGTGGLNYISGVSAISADDGEKDVKGKYHDDDGNEYDATATVTIEETETGQKSSGTGKATKNGNVVKSGKVSDFRSLQNPKDAPWEINFVADVGNAPGGQPTAIGVDSLIGGTSFQGSFVQSSAPGVPEPSTLGLGVLGLALIGVGARRRKHRNA